MASLSPTRLSLKRRTRPERLELGFGVYVICKPLGQLHIDTAEARAKAIAREMARSADNIADYALEAAEISELFSPEDPDLLIGSGMLLLSVELAMMGVVGWGGFDDENGNPIDDKDVNRRDLSMLFQARVPETDLSFAQVFFSLATRQAFLETAEKKD